MIDLNKYTKDSTFIWAIQNIQLPKSAPWEFIDRQWQISILDDMSKQIVTRKPTQIGLTTVMLAKMLHFADTHTCRLMMTLPRQDDVYDLVNARLGEIILESPTIRDKMSGIDNVRMKKFGKSWLHFAEMSVPPRMMDIDWMLNDEVDLSNMEYLEQAISRMDASKFGYHHRISTPTIHGFGVDALYQLSDKKVWIVKCGYCSHEQELDWFRNVANKNNQAWYICGRCANKLHPQDIREGHWVATGDTDSELSGYQINQMMCTYISPNKLWILYKTMSQKNFFNTKLGLPYTPTSGGFTRDMILDRCFADGHNAEMVAEKNAVYVLGCDQGDRLHVSIGKLVNGVVEIVYLNIVPFELGFDEIGRLMNVYNIRLAVIDGLPNHHPARRLVKEFPYRSYTGYFTSVDKMYIANEDDQRVNINKTDAYDHVLYNITNSQLQFYGKPMPLEPQVDSAIAHITNMRRDIEEQYSKSGGVKTFHVWKNIGPDHYADAILYMLIAADIVKSNTTPMEITTLESLYNQSWENILGPHDVIGRAMSDVGLIGEEKNLEPSLNALSNSSNKERKVTKEDLAPNNPRQKDSLYSLLLGRTK